jgi:serine/threonine-protein kinase RsbT
VSVPDTGTTVELQVDADVVRARHAVRDLSVALGFDLVSQTKLVTATSELARNTVLHGGGGTLLIVSEVAPDGRRGVTLTFRDEGPGILDVDRALTSGWSSGTGMGLGLGGSKRLVHEFELDTSPGRGTRVTVTMWRRG